MNTVTLGEDVRFHAGVPLVGAMSKMDAALKQGFHGNNCHLLLLNLCCSPTRDTWIGVEQNEFSGDKPAQGRLLPVPGKMRLFQGGEIIPQEITHKFPYFS
jgi:hypothetical protein